MTRLLFLTVFCSSVFVCGIAGADEPSPELKAIITKFREDLKSKTPQTRASAYTTIAELGNKVESERRAMCEGMLDTAPIVRTAAADCLKKIDEKSYKLALAIYINKDNKAVLEAARSKKESAPLVPLILKLAADISPAASNVKALNVNARETLQICVDSLCVIDPEDTGVNQAVIRMLANPVPEMRFVAVGNVHSLKNKKLAVNGLLTIAANPKDLEASRTKAIGLLPGIVDENTSGAVKKSLESLRFDDQPKVREAVEAAMKKIK